MEINEIIAADKACRKRVALAAEQAEKTDAETPAKVQEERQKIYDSGDREVETFRDQQNAFVESRTKETTEKYQIRMDRLNARFEEQKNVWVEHIVSAVTEE